MLSEKTECLFCLGEPINPKTHSWVGHMVSYKNSQGLIDKKVMHFVHEKCIDRYKAFNRINNNKCPICQTTLDFDSRKWLRQNTAKQRGADFLEKHFLMIKFTTVLITTVGLRSPTALVTSGIALKGLEKVTAIATERMYKARTPYLDNPYSVLYPALAGALFATIGGGALATGLIWAGKKELVIQPLTFFTAGMTTNTVMKKSMDFLIERLRGKLND